MSTTMLRTPQGNVVEISHDALCEMLAGLEPRALLMVIKQVAEQGRLDVLRDVIDAVELQFGKSVFEVEANLPLLEQMTRNFSLRVWLADTAQKPSRQALIGYWDQFMVQARIQGIHVGRISESSDGGGLWKATSYLARKMLENPAAYGFLPPHRLNNKFLVDQTIERLKDPERWFEVLVGDTVERMAQSQSFLNSFCLRDEMTGLYGALYAVGVCLHG